MKIGTFGLIGAAAFVSVAGADFTGWSTELITLGNGHTIMNVYANFDNVGDRVINVYDAAISTNTSGGFFQGTNPFWQPGTQNAMTSDDSWVAIGTNPSGSGNASGSITSGDPSFVKRFILAESREVVDRRVPFAPAPTLRLASKAGEKK